MNTLHIDTNKRQTLKMVAGLGVLGLTGTASALTNLNNIGVDLPNSCATQTLHCTLISQPHLADAHLLLSNPNNTDLAVARFASGTIRFDGMTAHCADGYIEPIVVPANKNVMVRFKIDPDLQVDTGNTDIVELEASTIFLPMGTRVVSFNALVRQGVADTVTPALPISIA